MEPQIPGNRFRFRHMLGRLFSLLVFAEGMALAITFGGLSTGNFTAESPKMIAYLENWESTCVSVRTRTCLSGPVRAPRFRSARVYAHLLCLFAQAAAAGFGALHAHHLQLYRN